MKESDHEKSDHGEVVTHPGLRVSWAWLFPVLAALASGWLFWSNWKSEGPEIEVVFASAPGMEAGKTPLIYRGVTAGIVSGVHLDESLKSVVLSVKLKAFAAGLAREGTLFWIDQPVIGLGKTSGIESLIQGNSLNARMGTGAPATRFVGREVVPLNPLEEPSLNLKLQAANIPFLDRGSPIFFRGVSIGAVRGKALDENKNPILSVSIDKEFADLVRSNSRFWSISGASARLGSGMLKLDLAGLKALLLGGITVDCFGEPGSPAQEGANYELCTDESAARASGSAFRVTFEDGLGIRPGLTELRYLGMPVGLVEAVKPDLGGRRVETTVRLQAGYECLQNEGSIFTLIRPQISLQGISGLETIIGGIFIACEPGNGSPGAPAFVGRTGSDAERSPGEKALTLTLHAKEIPTIGMGAPVLLRGIVVGKVLKKSFDENSRPVLTLEIRQEFAKALTRNAKFWRVPATSVKAGPGILNVDISGIETLLQGGVAFDVFGTPGEPVSGGVGFELFDTERAARADSPPIRIEFSNGQGLLAGQTQLRYLGVPVGLVEDVQASAGKVVATARLESGYEFLRRRGSIFSLVRPSISLKGVTGLESLVSGVYIECIPSSGGPSTDRFIGVSQNTAQAVESMEAGFEVVVQTASTTITPDAPVFYRGVKVGKISRKSLSPDGRFVELVASIDRPYAPLLRENTQFWDVSGLRVSLGFFAIKVQAASLRSLALGGIEFATPPEMGPRVRPGHAFLLNATPRREWLRWAPTIPVDGN